MRHCVLGMATVRARRRTHSHLGARESRCNAHRCQSVQRFRRPLVDIGRGGRCGTRRRHTPARHHRRTRPARLCAVSAAERSEARRAGTGDRIGRDPRFRATGRCHDSRRRGRAALRPSQYHDSAGSRCRRCGRPVGPASRSDGCACQGRRHVRPTFRIPWNGGATQYRTAGRHRRGLRAMAYVARIHTRRPGRSRRQRLRRNARFEGRRSDCTGERHCARAFRKT